MKSKTIESKVNTLDEKSKNALISLMIMIKRSEGLSMQESIDSVLGEGSHKMIADSVYDILHNRGQK